MFTSFKSARACFYSLRLFIIILRNTKRKDVSMKYRVHRFNIRMTEDEKRLEKFLNALKGGVVSIIPNVHPGFVHVDFLLIVEKIA